MADRKLSRLHDTSLNETEPAWSPDGSTLAFVAHYGDEDELWLKNVAAGWKRVLFKSSATGDKTARFRAPAFSPDGGRLALTVTLDQAIVPSGYAIYLILTKSGQATRLPGDLGTGLRPVDWSPDGRSLAFRNVAGTLQVLDVESGKLSQLGGLNGNRSNTTWSRDGKWIARVDRTGVWLVSPDGKEIRQVSKRSFTNADAPAHCFSADGSRLYLLRNEGASAKLEELVLATDELRTLTTLPGSLLPKLQLRHAPAPRWKERRLHQRRSHYYLLARRRRYCRAQPVDFREYAPPSEPGFRRPTGLRGITPCYDVR
ncbi:MAG: hypothetical protein K2X03_12825 [Bryobacteraceae bacterium]|nr:hypothetical protein [Bryobacteraceae bacterium]